MAITSLVSGTLSTSDRKFCPESLKVGDLIFYKPRGTVYIVTDRMLSVRMHDGWDEGVVYTDFISGGTRYCRTLRYFREGAWKHINKVVVAG